MCTQVCIFYVYTNTKSIFIFNHQNRPPNDLHLENRQIGLVFILERVEIGFCVLLGFSSGVEVSISCMLGLQMRATCSGIGQLLI